MVIVIARVEFDPSRLADIEPAIDIMMRATREESGCLSYSMAIENRTEAICTMVERWQDEAALKSHFHTPHMVAFQSAIMGAVRSLDAKCYDVVNERPVLI